MTRDPTAAEDCVQEAFINAWRALDRFEIRSSFATWLHRIAVNVVLGKRRRVSFGIEESVEAEVLEHSGWAFDTPVEESEIEQAIAGLPDGARDVLVLSGIYGYSHGETAQMLGVAEGTCKAQLHRARKLLKERLNVELN
jgi:RNA polymerase sigma-70 factor (ECF subfamily)